MSKNAKAVMASPTSSDASAEHDHHTPKHPKEIVGKAAHEAQEEDGIWNKVKAVGRELDRNVGGEYERREDQ